MMRPLSLSESWYSAVCTAWWDSWTDMLGDIGREVWRRWVPKTIDEYLDKHQLDAEARGAEHDRLDAELAANAGGGYAEGAGTGGQD